MLPVTMGFPPQWTRGSFSLQSERGLTVVCVHLRNKPPRFSVGIGYRKEPLLGSPLYSYGTSILTVCGQSILFHANMMYFYVLSLKCGPKMHINGTQLKIKINL